MLSHVMGTKTQKRGSARSPGGWAALPGDSSAGSRGPAQPCHQCPALAPRARGGRTAGGAVEAVAGSGCHGERPLLGGRVLG